MKNTPDEIIALMEAFKAGKRIQYRLDDQWRDCSGQPMFNFDSDCYRVAPEPKLRPWKPEEVPVGALIRVKGYERRGIHLLTYAGDGGIVGGAQCENLNLNNVTGSPQHALENWEHSTDGGKTWKPCGVEE